MAVALARIGVEFDESIVAPATSLGLRTIWINRPGEDAELQPDAELHSLAGLVEGLDSIVP